jgi:hypothetical protein
VFARTEVLLDVAQSSARLNGTGGGTSDLALLVLKAPPHVSLGTAIKYLRRTTSGAAGNSQGTTIKDLRCTNERRRG